MSQADVELLQRIYAHWGRGDYSAAEFLHPEFELIFSPGFLDEGVFTDTFSGEFTGVPVLFGDRILQNEVIAGESPGDLVITGVFEVRFLPRAVTVLTKSPIPSIDKIDADSNGLNKNPHARWASWCSTL